MKEEIIMLNDELEIKNSEIFKDIGEKIAQERKKKRRKVRGISKKLNINENFLNMIEKGDFLKIPKHVPRLGFVRSYAKFLELDISEELSKISLASSSDLKNVRKKIVLEKGIKKFFYFFLFLILIIFFFLIKKKFFKL